MLFGNAVFVIGYLLIYRAVGERCACVELAQAGLILGLSLVKLGLGSIEFGLLLIYNGRIAHHALGFLDLYARLFKLGLGLAFFLHIGGIAAVVLGLCRVVLRLALLILRPCIVKLRLGILDYALAPHDRPLCHELLERLDVFLAACLVFVGVHIALGIDADVDIGIVIRREAV